MRNWIYFTYILHVLNQTLSKITVCSKDVGGRGPTYPNQFQSGRRRRMKSFIIHTALEGEK